MLPWYVLGLFGALILAVSNVLTKKLLFKEHALEFLSSRGVATLLICILAFPFIPQVPSPLVLLLLYFLSLVISVTLWLEVKAIRHLEISVVEPLYNISPFFLLIFAYFFLGERITWVQCLGVFLLVVGAYVLELGSDHKRLGAPLKALISSPPIQYLILTLFLFSAVSTFEKYLFAQVIDYFTYLYFIWLFISINVVLSHTLLFGWKEVTRDLRKYGWKTLLISFLHLVSLFFHFKAVSLVAVSLALPVRRLSTLFATFLGGRMFHEQGLSHRLIACLILLSGAVLIIV